MRVLLVVNPIAHGVTERRVEALMRVLESAAEVRTAWTNGPGHAGDLTRQARGDCDAVVLFSGDGVFNEAVDAADGTTRLGFLPGGRTNVLPRALGFPRDPVRAAGRLARALRDGRYRRISAGRANGRRFATSCGIGLDAELVARINAERRRTGRHGGDIAFVLTAVRLLAEHRARLDPVLEVDGLGRAALAMVANCDPYSYAGPLPLHVAPGARFELGLDFLAPRRVRPGSLTRFAWHLFTGHGRLRASDAASGHDLDRIRIVCDVPVPVHVDGEDLGPAGEVVLESERGALSVLC